MNAEAVTGVSSQLMSFIIILIIIITGLPSADLRARALLRAPAALAPCERG